MADQSAMLLKTRIAAYTADYFVTVICPKCKESIRYCFDLSKYSVVEPDFSNNESPLRTVVEADLFEVSPCTFPVFQDASSSQVRTEEQVLKHAQSVVVDARKSDNSELEILKLKLKIKQEE